jgi:predicted amidohydrolase
MLEEINVALGQVGCRAGEKDYNIELMEKKILEAKERGTNLILFPEFSLTGYVTPAHLHKAAEPIPGPSIRYLEEITEKEDIYVILGMLEQSRESHTPFTTAVLFGPKGFIGKYQKRQLQLEDQAPVFETPVGKIGLIISYDIFFPEISRLLMLKGVQLITCISASPSVHRKLFENFTIARAAENNVFLAYANLTGSGDESQFYGGSRIIAPNGDIILQAKYNEEDLVIGRINYSCLEQNEMLTPTIAGRNLKLVMFNLLKKQIKDHHACDL